VLLHQGVGLGQRLEAVVQMAQVGRDVRQHGAQVENEQRCPSGAKGGDALAYLGHRLLVLGLPGERPPP
jgi:hypothetical protein